MPKIIITIDDLVALASLAKRNGTTDVFATLALEWAEHASAEIVRLRIALERIASTTGSDDPCRHFVDIARKALAETTHD